MSKIVCVNNIKEELFGVSDMFDLIEANMGIEFRDYIESEFEKLETKISHLERENGLLIDSNEFMRSRRRMRYNLYY